MVAARRGSVNMDMPPYNRAMQSPAGPRWRARQFHNQPATSHTHGFLVDLWTEVARETGGRLLVEVCPQNAGKIGRAHV